MADPPRDLLPTANRFARGSRPGATATVEPPDPQSDDTRQRILRAARHLVQTRGFDGFSYADVSDQVGIRKASIHHYFPTKADLALALIERFRDDCRAALKEIDHAEPDAERRLAAYARIFEAELNSDNRMCLCGMLAAGRAGLSQAALDALTRAVEDHLAWLARALPRGTNAARRRRAEMLFAGLEGAMLIARVTGGVNQFRTTAQSLIAAVSTSSTRQ